MLDFIDTPARASVSYTKAISIIESHGWTAMVTKDGLLALSARGYDPERHGVEADDRWCEEPTVFEIDSMGRVDSRAVRLWLGY